MLLLWDSWSQGGGVYLAQVDGATLSFQLRDGVFVDDQTGSHWSLSGEAKEGPPRAPGWTSFRSPSRLLVRLGGVPSGNRGVASVSGVLSTRTGFALGVPFPTADEPAGMPAAIRDIGTWGGARGVKTPQPPGAGTKRAPSGASIRDRSKGRRKEMLSAKASFRNSPRSPASV